MSHDSKVIPVSTCRKVQPSSAQRGKQELLYAEGISANSVGSNGLHMQLATLPPLLRAKAHKHVEHETAIYVISGESGVWFGGNLQHHETVVAGEFFYIPADMPHMPYNPSATVPCVTVIARTDPRDEESVVLLPHLDELHS